METKILNIDPNNIDIEKILIASDVIKKGGLVAFPTETVYGLGADAFNENAVKKIFIAKGRPNDNPLIVHITEKIDINDIVEYFPENAILLKNKFWPGPLTMILPKSKRIPFVVTGNLNTVAVRMPSHNIAKSLINYSGCPIAAPSANISGKPSPTKAEHVIKDMFGKIDVIIDGGQTDIGLESTVIDLTKDIPIIYRPGKITVEEIEKVIGKVELSPIAKAELRLDNIIAMSPGMKYRHYSPDTPLILYEGEGDKVINAMENDLNVLKNNNKKVALILLDNYIKSDMTIVFNSKDLENIARNIFSTLRELDKYKFDYILVQGVDDQGLGLAIMNRLRKASTNIVKVE
ncbi:MAG: L-threonylcarbamoyladenylate synthase [Thermoplasmata archaeon]